MNGMAVSAPPILKTLKTKDMIAKTILQQIGGKRFTAMTGSRDFIDMGNGLRMSLARNKTSANRLDIIYDEGADLYNMRFYRRTFSKKTFECKTKDIAVHEGIYFDMLEEMFTMVTGLYTRYSGNDPCTSEPERPVRRSNHHQTGDYHCTERIHV